MYLDVFTLSALVDEFMDTLVGGRIQDSIDVDDTGIGLEIYANHQRQYLYMSADKTMPRIHLTGEKLRRGLTRPTQVGLLFRRYVEGGLVTHVSQPDWERIIHFEIQHPEGDYEIIIEPMERRSNILLVQRGQILDCMNRVGPDENRFRLSLPNHEYVPPPAQTNRRDPSKITLEDMIGFYEQVQDEKQKAFQVLTGNLLGMSPLIAREIIFRAESDVQIKARDANAESIFSAFKDVVTPLLRREWSPGIVETEDGVEAFSVYPITYLPGWHPVETISAAVNAYYGTPTGEDAYTAAKTPLFKAIREARGRLQGKLDSLESSLKNDDEREVLRQSGELILAYQYGLEDNQTELRAQYDPDKPELVIQLDPKMSPLDNAQRYFTKYNKAKRALEDVPQLVRETKNELNYLDQLEIDLEGGTNWPDIDEVQQALQAGGYWRGKRIKRKGGGQSAPLRIVTKDGFVIWVGRNSRQNEMVTFKKANGDDLWLHARNVPGAHVIIKFDGRNIPEDVIEQAAAIAAYYSKSRAEGAASVDVTRIKYVKSIKGAGQGMVTYRNERNITVKPQSEKAFESP
ncbi:MAG: NFACT RNA binding domain-containing protein [Aggregatilineales bacterium]